ncbi:hypothetical protein PC122_g6909 [Phytophthora cactorum]|nr:hypothetical protein PC122_g6909 [Phytophthora cactorum]
MLHTRSLGGEDVVILKTRSRTFDHFLAVEALCWRMRLLSRRVEGLKPEEHKALDTVVREDWVVRKATQEDGAAEGDGEVSSDQEPPLVERLAQDANAIPGVGESAGVNPGMETSRVKEECAREGDTQASVRDAGLVESPDVVDLASGSPPSEKVELPNDLVVKIKQAPTRVRADACNHDADANPGVSLSA